MRQRLPLLITAVVVITALLSCAVAQALQINIRTLAAKLERAPVQILDISPNTLSRADVRRLSALINKRDPGRIYIAVVLPLSQSLTAEVDQDLSNTIKRPGIVIVVAGHFFRVMTTWQSGNAAAQRLAAAVEVPHTTLSVQLQRAIDSFAAADAAARHPVVGLAGSAPTSSPSATTPASAPPAAPQRTSKKSTGADTGLLIALGVLAGLALVAVIWGDTLLLRLRPAVHRRKVDSPQRKPAGASSGRPGRRARARARAAAGPPPPSAKPRPRPADAGARSALEPSATTTSPAAPKRATVPAARAAPEPEIAQPVPAPEPPDGDKSPDVVAALIKLTELHDRDLLTDAELADATRKLLGK